MSTPITTPHIAPPSDATDVDEWRTPAGGPVRRWFVGTMRGDGPHVNVWGRQYADGSIERFIQSDAGHLGHRLTSLAEAIRDLDQDLGNVGQQVAVGRPRVN